MRWLESKRGKWSVSNADVDGLNLFVYCYKEYQVEGERTEAAKI